MEATEMKRATPVLLLATLLAATSASAMSPLDQTSWSITGRDKVKIPHEKALKTTVSDADGVTLSVDPTSQFFMPVPGAFLSGTITDKGRHGFTAMIDQTAIDAVRTNLTDLIVNLTGATAVDVTSFTVTAKGHVNGKGTKLKLKVKTVLKGSAIIQGVEKSGTLKETGTYKGVPSAS
jgi:hypothetical protein